MVNALQKFRMLHSPTRKKTNRLKPISKNLSKVTNPVIAILPSRPRSSYIENYNRPIGQPCSIKDIPHLSGSIPKDKCSQNVLSKSTKNFHSNKVHFISRPPSFKKCLNPLVSIPPMTIEVQSNINIYPKRRPEKVAPANKTIYEYKFPYTSSEEDEENTEFLSNSIDLLSKDLERNEVFFESRPILNDDENVAASRIPEERCSKMDSNLKSRSKCKSNWAFDQDSATDCEDSDIKQRFNIKPLQCNSEDDFILSKFSSRLEERLGIFLDNAKFMPSSTINEEPNLTNAPVCELSQNSETVPEKDEVSNNEVQKIMPQPSMISKVNEFTNNKIELFSSTSLAVDDEVKFFNKSSQTEPCLEVKYYRNEGVCLDNMIINNENINSCNGTKTNIVEFNLESIVSCTSKQKVTKENASVCLNETFDIDQPCESRSFDKNFVDSFTSLKKDKSGLASFPIPSQQMYHDADELPRNSFHENTCNEICTQNKNGISKPDSVDLESPGKILCNSSKEEAIISCQKLVESKGNECTLHKISDETKTIKIDDCDNNKETFLNQSQVKQPGLNKFSDESLGIISPSPYENVNEIHSHYSEIASFDKTDDITLPPSSEIEYSEVHQSNNEVSNGELCQPTYEIGDLTISEGELGFEASLTSDIFPLGHITIKVTPKDSSFLESLPSFSLDFNTLKHGQVAKETQTEFPNRNKYLNNGGDDGRNSWTNTDINETISSGEVILDSDKLLHCGRTHEMGNMQKENIRLRKQEMEILLKENIKLRNKLSCYSGRFIRDP